MNLKQLVLKPDEEKRILKGEYWVYCDEVASDLKQFKSGELVELVSAKGDFIACGYVNLASKIVFRVLSFEKDLPVNRDFFYQRIGQADRLRLILRPENRYYRMVFGEADYLPGLVIDRFDDLLVLQITTAGMELFRDLVIEVLLSLYPQATIIEKSFSEARIKDGLPLINRLVAGKCGVKVIEINQVKFEIDFLNSQKTGFFLDQRDNYLLLKEIAKGRRVLDVFSYLGGWGLHACRFGARAVDFIEISSNFLLQTKKNVLLNGFAVEKFNFIKADAVKFLKKMSKDDSFYDLIILDPPAFVKNRQTLRSGLLGYKEINLRALKMLVRGGFLVSCSCSHFLSKDQFLEVVAAAASDAHRQVRLINYSLQPYDHPVLTAMNQSQYLKCALFYVD